MHMEQGTVTRQYYPKSYICHLTNHIKEDNRNSEFCRTIISVLRQEED